MRNILIALVLLMTVLTFYSALWFKSESIEDDITQRVTDELETSGATGIDVGVDGRHVTLSGIVYDETTEAAYLDTADRTYGALGPIDGLTYLAVGGYITATKTPDGLTLRGTVPSEADRVELVAKAVAATNGTVDDQLTIGGLDGALQDEAEFGLAQIAGLGTGAMTVAAGTYVLSGTTDGAVADATADLTDREGWTAFVSSPEVENGLEAEVGRLNGVVTQRDATIAGLTVDRDGLSNQLDGLRANLTADQAALRAELDGTRSIIAERDQTIVEQTERLASQANVIEARQDALAEQAVLIRDRDTTIANLNGRVGSLEEELEQRQEVLGATDEEFASLRGQIATQTDAIAELEGKIVDLTGVVAQRDDTIAALQSDLDGERANAAASDNDQIAALSGQVTDRDATIAELNGTVDGLQGNVDTLEGTVADLRGQVSEGEGSLVETAAQIAALTAATQAADAKTTALTDQVDDLAATVAQRDATIESLRATPNATPVAMSADQCAAQAANALEGSRINFVTASAEIENVSIALLERLTGIALACVDEDALIVEVGGHTDSDGSDEANQALSEARAQAVVDFMTARGVPSGGLVAAGYGESQPVADNATAEGKAQNRRISFDWQAR